ncbi:MAG: hypothetical protein J1E99_03645 [Muribaculaceae bacterium]|nr:hypothetical protein [Muribaculaceae bacterium]
MAKYTSTPVTVPANVNSLFEKFEDLTALQSLLDRMPEDLKQKVGDVTFEKDSISIQTSQVGEIKFVVKERVKPDKIVFGTESSPVPLTLTAKLTPTGENSTEVLAETDVEIPAMLKPLVGPAMQKATDQFGQLIGQLASVK